MSLFITRSADPDAPATRRRVATAPRAAGLVVCLVAAAACGRSEPAAPAEATGAPSEANTSAPGAGSAEPGAVAAAGSGDAAQAPTAPAAAEASGVAQNAANHDGAGGASAFEGTPSELGAPSAQSVADHTVAAVRCTVGGAPLVGSIGQDVIRDVERVGDRVWIADSEGNLRRYLIANPDGCSLEPDAAFGDGGVLDLERDIDSLTADNNGRVVASTGVFESWVFDGTAVPWRCTATAHGFLTLSPDGSHAVGRFVGRDVTRVTFAGAGADARCEGVAEPPAVLFRSVQAIGFVGEHRLVGGMIAEEAGTARPHQVLAYDSAGEVAWRQGNVDDPFADDAYGTVATIEAGTEGAVVLDSTNATLHLLDRNGMHLGRVAIAALTGAPTPAASALELSADGTGFVAVSVQRRGETPAWDGYLFAVTGL